MTCLSCKGMDITVAKVRSPNSNRVKEAAESFWNKHYADSISSKLGISHVLAIEMQNASHSAKQIEKEIKHEIKLLCPGFKEEIETWKPAMFDASHSNGIILLPMKDLLTRDLSRQLIVLLNENNDKIVICKEETNMVCPVLCFIVFLGCTGGACVVCFFFSTFLMGIVLAGKILIIMEKLMHVVFVI